MPVPANTNDVVQAIIEGLMLRGERWSEGGQLSFADFSADFGRQVQQLNTQWDNVTDKEKRSRTIFAQHTLDPAEVAAEWQAVRAAIGAGVDVARFIRDTVVSHGGFVAQRGQTLGGEVIEVRLPNHAALRAAAGDQAEFMAGFALPVPSGALYLTRTHPIVTGLAAYVLDTALDPSADGVARRCGAIRTRAVTQTTTLLLLRYRFHIITHKGDREFSLLAEESELAGFRGAPHTPQWLAPDEAEALLQAEPDQNIAPGQATQFLQRIIAALPDLGRDLDQRVLARGEELLAAHQGVRAAARLTGVRHRVEPQLPPDVLGVYVLLPVI
ncbi:MAG TPA: hypothetical protein VNK95_10735 [Caldilineaceae bacterium]|nr:hypothetical protein [Caldilineaceae bacterium]